MADVYDVKTFNAKKNIKGNEELIIEGIPAKNLLKDWRLRHHSVMWLRSKFVRNPAACCEHFKALRSQDTRWMNATLFEDLCNFDPELEKIAKSGDKEKTQQRIEKIFVEQYIGLLVAKFKKILPDLTNYFAAKAAYGGLFEKDRKKITSEGAGEVEDTNVCHIADCWSVRAEQNNAQ